MIAGIFKRAFPDELGDGIVRSAEAFSPVRTSEEQQAYGDFLNRACDVARGIIPLANLQEGEAVDEKGEK